MLQYKSTDIKRCDMYFLMFSLRKITSSILLEGKLHVCKKKTNHHLHHLHFQQKFAIFFWAVLWINKTTMLFSTGILLGKTRACLSHNFHRYYFQENRVSIQDTHEVSFTSLTTRTLAIKMAPVINILKNVYHYSYRIWVHGWVFKYATIK